MTNPNEIEQAEINLQKACRAFVEAHIILNVEGVVRRLLDVECDEWDALRYGPIDYQQAAEDAGWENYTDEFGVNSYRDTNDGATTCSRNWITLCHEEGIEVDDYAAEIYEYWAVDNYTAELLDEETGEHVEEDFHGLTVWARTTTGQAIAMDHAIREIVQRRMNEEAW